MPGVGVAYRSNGSSMWRNGNPVRHLLADQAARPVRILVGAWRPSGNDQQYAMTFGNRLAQASLKRGMGGRQRVAVKVDCHVGRNASCGNAPVPSPIQRIREALLAGQGR